MAAVWLSCHAFATHPARSPGRALKRNLSPVTLAVVGSLFIFDGGNSGASAALDEASADVRELRTSSEPPRARGSAGGFVRG